MDELNEETGEVERTREIQFEFYQKPMVDKQPIRSNTAIAWKTKKAILVEDVHRRIYNTSSSLPWTTTAKHLTDFMVEMKKAGYKEDTRMEVLKKGIGGFEEKEEKEREGEEPVH